MNKRKYQKYRSPIRSGMTNGFTLIELLIYIAIVSVFMTGAISFTWDIIYGREKAFQQQVVERSLRYTSARIGYELRRAENVDSFTASSIVLVESDTSLTTIEQSGDKIQITFGADGPYDISSNQIKVTNFTVTDLSPSSSDSKNIRVDITAEQASQLSPGQQKVTSTASFSTEFNSQFNFARQLLIDLTGATYTGSNSLTNAKVRNAGTQDVYIDKMIVSWTGVGENNNITGIQIGGGDPEFTGSVPNGTLIDILDVLLPASAPQTPINSIDFSGNIDGSLVYVTFILSDGSSATGTIDLTGDTSGGSGSCLSECQNAGYTTSAICRRRPQQCVDNGETNVTSGDQYCTVNPNDTCCCQ